MQTYGILAHPVGHSLSPLIHNAGFESLKIDAQYTSFDIEPSNLEQFMDKVRQEKIAGLSVSIPHKISIIPYLDEISPETRNIGAVNTVYWKNEKLCGTNTDVFGAIAALEEKINLEEKRVALFGAGGAAHAIAYGLVQKKAKTTILALTFEESKNLGEKFNIDYDISTNYQKENFDIIINATPIGMSPKVENSILKPENLNPNQIVFDIVYNPLQTTLIQNAQKIGCKTITGNKMFLLQANKQFEIWTQQKAPTKIMEEVLLRKLESNLQ